MLKNVFGAQTSPGTKVANSLVIPILMHQTACEDRTCKSRCFIRTDAMKLMTWTTCKTETIQNAKHGFIFGYLGPCLSRRLQFCRFAKITRTKQVMMTAFAKIQAVWKILQLVKWHFSMNCPQKMAEDRTFLMFRDPWTLVSLQNCCGKNKLQWVSLWWWLRRFWISAWLFLYKATCTSSCIAWHLVSQARMSFCSSVAFKNYVREGQAMAQ